MWGNKQNAAQGACDRLDCTAGVLFPIARRDLENSPVGVRTNSPAYKHSRPALKSNALIKDERFVSECFIIFYEYSHHKYVCF